MIFLTVGTQFPFNRLVRAVDDAAGENGFSEPIFAQIGDDSYCPRNFKAVVTLDKASFDKHFCEADSIISHAGMGTIMMALEHRKPLLVMARLREYGEVVNNHQLAIAEKFEQLGHLLLARGAEDVPVKMEMLSSFVPRPRRPKATVVAGRIAEFLNDMSESRNGLKQE